MGLGVNRGAALSQGSPMVWAGDDGHIGAVGVTEEQGQC